MIAALAASLLLAVASPAPSAQPTIDDLAWLTGDRFHDSERSTTREVWIGPGDGMLLGVSQMLNKDGRPGQFEFMRIAPTSDGRLAFHVAPSGQPATVFPLKSFEGGRVVFENPEHDFPQRVVYWDKGDGVVGARIEGSVNGQVRAMEWSFAPRR